MDTLLEGYSALAAHLTRHCARAMEMGLAEIAKDLGMDRQDSSDDCEIALDFMLGDEGGALTLSYYLAPCMSEGGPIVETYDLELSGRSDAIAQRWKYIDGQPEQADLFRQAA